MNVTGKWSRFLYGGDYNPNQWPREVWEEDMRFFKDAHINSATINVFSWAKIQPAEDRYDFSELDAIVERLARENFEIVMATSTGALPAWLVKRYPEVARTDYEGRQHKFGGRHNACPNSPVFQKFASALVDKLAERYANHPNVKVWHVSNEYGGECYCPHCEAAFRRWLKEKYGTIEALNKAWNMEFWGHLVYDWDEIVLPNELGDSFNGGESTAFAGMSVDYRRFNSDSILNNYKMERDIIRRHNPEAIITTNLMGTYKGLDYFRWAKEMDVISWDNYPRFDTPWSFIALRHDLMYGLKNMPFMLMEQTPSQQNWQPYNTLKRPGQMRAQSYQTVAHGGDTIQFFQLRRSVGGCEKFHGAVISHAGTENTRVFRECAELGEELEKIGPEILGAEAEAEVGILFDWDNYWALEYTSGPNVLLKYVDQIHRYYSYCYERHIPVRMLPVDADFSKYKVILAPVLYMVKEGVAEALEAFVANGGTLLTTTVSGIVDQSDNVYLGGYPGPLRRLAGLWVEEWDALAPEQSNCLVFPDGNEVPCEMVCDLMHLEGAEALAHYSEDFYAGMPAAAKHDFGKGSVTYVGTILRPENMDAILAPMFDQAGVKPLVPEQTGLEISRRRKGNTEYIFVINFKDEAQTLPQSLAGLPDLLTGKPAEAGETLPKWTVKVLKRQS